MGSVPRFATGRRSGRISRTVCKAALAHTVRDNPEVSYSRMDLFEKYLGLMHAWDRHAINDPARIVSIGASV